MTHKTIYYNMFHAKYKKISLNKLWLSTKAIQVPRDRINHGKIDDNPRTKVKNF